MTTWKAAGEAQQKIYAVIDPDNQIEEMHDENHQYINNNLVYGLMELGAASYVDMGMPQDLCPTIPFVTPRVVP